MKKNRKRPKYRGIILIASFILLVVSLIVYTVYVHMFNYTERTFNSGDTTDEFTITVKPRTGHTDSWVKIVEENGDSKEYLGTIYDVTIDNIGDSIISDWKLNIDIPENCFVNNAWCGSLEIHQNVGVNELVQTIDLRNYVEKEISLDYKIMNPDLMIPLYKGDYFIYHPDRSTNEFPISTQSQNKFSHVVSGIIFYTADTQPLELSDFQMIYHLEKNYVNCIAFKIIGIFFIVWLMYLIVFIVVEINMNKVKKRFIQDEHIINQSIEVFTQFFEAKDTYTNGHSKRVAQYSRMVAERLGLADEICRKIYYVALMHDCGKCYIPDEILKKPGKLTLEEYEIIKSHTTKGAEMVENFTSIEHIRDGVLYHHERYDGGGYPQGLSGDTIPLISRIICISDSFDAMNSRRCYRDKLSRGYIISELESNVGRQFDPEMVKIMLDLIKEEKVIIE